MQCVHSMGWDFRVQFRGLPLVIPGCKLISSAVCLQKCSASFTLTLLQCGVFYLVSLRISLNPEQLAKFRGGPRIPRPTPFLISSAVLEGKHGIQAVSETVSRQIRSKVKGLLSCFWSLEETSSLLICLTSRYAGSLDVAVELFVVPRRV